MPLAIDLDKLLDNLFQAKANTPVKEKVQEVPKPKRGNTDIIDKALDNLFRKDKLKSEGSSSASDTHINEADIPSLQACNLYVFMKKIVIGHFGMGYDYVIEIDGHLVKSWFTIPEAIEMAKKIGYRLTVPEARAFLDTLINRRYIETDNGRYRRCAFWDKKMENYLLRYGR